MQRAYYYEIDQEGRLFHDGTELTDPQFLDFFFARLQKNPDSAEYPFVSPCGREKNYIRCAGTPIVFRAFREDRGRAQLLYAGNSLQPFEPEALQVNGSGQLFHPVQNGLMGRLGRHALLEISQHISFAEEGQDYVLHWQSRQYRIAPVSGE